jgi:serine protease Do
MLLEGDDPMRPDRWHLPLKALPALTLVVMALGLWGTPAYPAADEAKTPTLHPALTKPAPEDVEDLRAIQGQVRKVLDKVIPATVGLRIGQASGSGVIIDKEGHVLTAGHVSGSVGRDVTIILHDGRTVKGKTLGANRGIDSGMVKITDEGSWPHVEMGNSADLEKGQWCLAVGHPGGFRSGRTPVVRLGRIVNIGRSVVQTDCALVGGDSGGPLFDMNGKVIGIHSRIGKEMASNMHVPVDTYRDNFEKLAKGEVMGLGRIGRGEPYLGVEIDREAKECRIAKVTEDTAAQKAGLQPNDVITMFDDQKIENFEALQAALTGKRPGSVVALGIRRGSETLTIKLTLGRRPNP